MKVNISNLLDDFINVISENKEITITPNENLLKIIKDYKINNVKKDDVEKSKGITQKELLEMMNDDSFWD